MVPHFFSEIRLFGQVKQEVEIFKSFPIEDAKSHILSAMSGFLDTAFYTGEREGEDENGHQRAVHMKGSVQIKQLYNACDEDHYLFAVLAVLSLKEREEGDSDKKDDKLKPFALMMKESGEAVVIKVEVLKSDMQEALKMFEEENGRPASPEETKILKDDHIFYHGYLEPQLSEREQDTHEQMMASNALRYDCWSYNF